MLLNNKILMQLPMEQLSFLLVDDHEIYLGGLSRALHLLFPHCKTKSVKSGPEALQLLQEHSYDVIFMDISMKGMSGIETTQLAIQEHPHLKIVGLSQLDDEGTINLMIDSGASAFVSKYSEASEIKNAVLSVLKGEQFFCKDSLESLRKKTPFTNDLPILVELLTINETKVIKLICSGYSNKQISQAMNLAEKSIEYYRTKIYTKTKTTNIAQLVNYAIKNKLHSVE